MTITKTAEKEIFRRWYAMTGVERVAEGFPIRQIEMIPYLKVSHDTLIRWQRDFKDEGIYPPKKKKVIKNGIRSGERKVPRDLPPEIEEAVEDIEKLARSWWTEKRIEAVCESVYNSSLGIGKGNANSQKLALQLVGALTEKKEIKFVLSADDYFRIRKEAASRADASRIQQLSRESDGDRGVLSKSPLLLSGEGISTEQEHLTEGEVAAVGISA